MKQLIAIALVASAVAAQADVIVYKVTGPTHTFGGNLDTRKAGPMYLVWNPDTGEVGDIYGDPSSKTYGTESLSVSWFNILGPKGRSGFGFKFHDQNGDDEAFTVGYGYNATLAITTPIIGAQARIITAPQVMTCKSEVLKFDSQMNATIADSSYTLTFSKADTISANFSQRSVSDEVNFLKTKLLSAGYLPGH